jgi:hypothetical protein
MPVVVTATITARCWKQHTCCACGCVYRYLFERTASASGGPATDTRGAAARKIVKKISDEIDECPCPTCGTIQPDMVARGKITWHMAFTIITGVILLLTILPTLKGSVPLDQAGKVAAGVAAFGVLGHLLTAWGNPNARPQRNMREVQAKMALGRLEVVQPGGPPQYGRLPVNMSLVHALCLFGIFVAPPAFLAVVEVSREHPMPRNPTLKPEVVGPGAEVTIPLKSTIRSLGGHWRGTSATAKVVNSEETGAPETIAVATNADPWAKPVSVKDNKNPYEQIEPFAKVTLPDDPKLGGKQLRLQITVAVTYPVQTPGRTVAASNDISTGSVQQDVEINVAEAGVDRLYNDTWNRGMLIGLTGCLLGGVVLTGLGYATRARAMPHQVLPLWAPREASIAPGFYGIDDILQGRDR